MELVRAQESPQGERTLSTTCEQCFQAFLLLLLFSFVLELLHQDGYNILRSNYQKLLLCGWLKPVVLL